MVTGGNESDGVEFRDDELYHFFGCYSCIASIKLNVLIFMTYKRGQCALISSLKLSRFSRWSLVAEVLMMQELESCRQMRSRWTQLPLLRWPTPTLPIELPQSPICYSLGVSARVRYLQEMSFSKLSWMSMLVRLDQVAKGKCLIPFQLILFRAEQASIYTSSAILLYCSPFCKLARGPRRLLVCCLSRNRSTEAEEASYRILSVQVHNRNLILLLQQVITPLAANIQSVMSHLQIPTACLRLSTSEDNQIILLMEREETQAEFAPWSHDEFMPRNIIIQFHKSSKANEKSKGFINDTKKQKLTANLDRFIQKRRKRLEEKYSKRQEESPPRTVIEAEQKIPIKNIQPESFYMNETVKITQLFPSYALTGSEKELSFFKPHRYQSNQRTETRQQKGKRSPIRYSFKPRHENVSELARKLSSKTKLHFSVTKRSFHQNEEKGSLNCSLSKSQKSQEAKQGTRCNFTIKKQANKTQRFQDILQFLNMRMKERPTLQRTKTSSDTTELDKCLKAKRHFYLNLPKIQFIEIDH